MQIVRDIASARLSRLGATIVVALLLAGVATAYYATAGTGQGSASGGTAASLSATAAAPVAGLYPGGSAELAVTLSNPNPSIVHIPSLQLDTSQGSSGFDVDGSHAAGCTTPALSFTAQSNGGSGWDVPPKTGTTNGTLALHLAGAVAMGAGASNGCQGATFTVYVQAGS